MNKAIYIATIEANSGKSILTLGLMRLLLGKMARVGYFRPIINDYPEGRRDNHIETILTHFNLPMAYEEAYACTRSEVVLKNSRNQEDEVLDT
ncbi:MAG TPA: AAA family ATPase, partial [Robiginitalea sp.]|nr:AAA family ATPase [Robiginitalea sp.]